jgi:hypothetical protein
MVEALTNIGVGCILALAVQALAFPLLGIETSLAQDSAVAAIFTAVSMLRSYLLRRLFEWRGVRRAAVDGTQP